MHHGARLDANAMHTHDGKLRFDLIVWLCRTATTRKQKAKTKRAPSSGGAHIDELMQPLDWPSVFLQQKWRPPRCSVEVDGAICTWLAGKTARSPRTCGPSGGRTGRLEPRSWLSVAAVAASPVTAALINYASLLAARWSSPLERRLKNGRTSPPTQQRPWCSRLS